MFGFVFFLFGLIVTLVQCIIAAKSDFSGFKIPNSVSVVIIGAFAVAFVPLELSGHSGNIFQSIASHIGAAGIVFVVTAFMFAIKKLGAGDSKFATAVALWVGFKGLVPFIFFMSLAGGIIAGFSLYLQKKKPFKNPTEGNWIDKVQKGGGAIPYGIAIAFGALAGFIALGYFDLSVWANLF